MNKRLAVAGTAALSIGALALSSPAWASGPVDTGQGLQVTITNPAAATITLSASTLALDATTNVDSAHEAPTEITPNNFGGGAEGQGGIYVRVVSNNADGYAVQLDGPAGGFTSSGQTPMPNADFHVDTASIDTNGHVVIASNTLDNPVTIISNTGVSGTVWDTNAPTNDPTRLANPNMDEGRFAAYINPNVLVGGKVYSGQVEAFYVPNL
jgi:hypothetical protein